MRTTILSLTLLVACATCLPAVEIYVNNLSGDDKLNGGEASSAGGGVGPVRTITKALRLAQPGDRIIVANTSQPYRESITLQGGTHSGIHGSLPLVIEGSGAVVEGTENFSQRVWEHFRADVFRTSCAIKSHQVLFLDHKPADRLRLDAALQVKPVLEPTQYFLWDGYIYFRVENNKVPQDYQTSVAGLTMGLTLYNVSNVIVKDLTFQGFAYDGVNAHDNVRNVKLENVRCQENGRSGFTIAGASQVMLDRCTALSNHEAQLRVEPLASAELRECQIEMKTANAMLIEGKIHELGVKE